MGDINFSSAYAPRLRFLDTGAGGVDVDLFDENSGRFLGGRFLHRKDVKDLVEFLTPPTSIRPDAASATSTERMPVAHMSELQVGDVVETAYDRSTLHAYVMRVPKPAEPEFGHGTAYVFDRRVLAQNDQQKRYRGFRSEFGVFYFLSDAGVKREARPDQYENFRLEDQTALAD